MAKVVFSHTAEVDEVFLPLAIHLAASQQGVGEFESLFHISMLS